MKAAIYARVSTEDQDADKQVEICKEFCQKNNFEIYEIYKDIISGITSSRPNFNRLLEDMRKNKFNCIVVTKLDRLGRSLSHLLSLFMEFERRGVHFIATSQNIDTTTAAGKLQMQILGAFAEFERNLISERTKEGLKKRKEGKRGKDKKPRIRRWFRKPIEITGGSIAI